MGRQCHFAPHTKKRVLARQRGRCAICGMRLSGLAAASPVVTDSPLVINFHHVVPAQLGGDRSEDNCVAVCRGEVPGTDNLSCHYRVHYDGRFGTGIVAPPAYFRFSHGRDRQEHEQWVRRMSQRYRR